ncbi:hypothetical protein EB001_17990, partial [bacterium]|nr:hypothetical protein [bacterium]
EQAFKSSAVAFPTIELDPISPKFEIRQSSSNSSEDGIKVIKIDPTFGIRAGVTSNFKFTVDMDGNMTAKDAIFSSGTFNGNITSSATISGGVISGATIQTANDGSTYGYLKLNSQGSVLQLLGSDNTVYGELYQYNNGNEIILRHGNSRPFGYPYAGNSPTGLGAMLSLNPYTITLQYVNATGVSSYGLDISSNGDNMFTGTVQSDSSGGANSVGNTLRYFRNTIINNTTPSGSGFSIGDIWIQY